MADSENWILKYYQAIKDGSVTVGHWIRLLYERIIQDLENRVYFFDQKKANRVISFFENFCHHSKGKLAPQLVKLELWQKALLSCAFGLVDKDGVRIYREVLVVMGRKNGKSLLASGIAEYMAYADGERGADCYFLAPKLDQADIVFNDFWQSVSAEPDLMKITKKRKMDIYIESTNTSIKKVPFSEKKSDGYNPHLTVCDEIASWAGENGNRQYTVMTSALGSREQPMIFSITTANYINGGIYDELIRRSTSFLQGNSREKRLLPFLYQIDNVEKWNDLSELQKSLPNLGVSVSVDYILEEIAKAEQSVVDKAEFLCKMACIKQTASTAWFRAEDVRKMFSEQKPIGDFANHYALAGIDLSQTTDLTSACLLVEKDGLIWVISHFWIPGERLAEATQRDAIPYQAMIERGFLSLSGDEFVDYKDVFNWIESMRKEYKILPLQVGYDRYSSQYLITDLEKASYHCESVFQGWNLTGIEDTFEGMLREGRIRCIDDNDLLKIHMMDAAQQIEAGTSAHPRKKLVKLSKSAHVDGVAAILDAMCMRQNHWAEMGKRLMNSGQ
jgi:phage terminase large subunit-like protein